MTSPERRCTVDLGDLHDPDAPRHTVRALRDKTIRDAIESYLELTGVILDRRNPRGWFIWLDRPRNSIFITRCSDPPASTASDNRWQPWYYFVEAEMHEEGGQAKATAFYHQDFLDSEGADRQDS